MRDDVALPHVSRQVPLPLLHPVLTHVPTNMTEDVVREVALPLGLVDNKVCAIDETWSGLRIVWRKENWGGSSAPI